MSVDYSDEHQKEYKKARDLKVIVRFETDNSKEGKMRVAQVKNLICHLILLGQKRGRPSKKNEEDLYAAA